MDALNEVKSLGHEKYFNFIEGYEVGISMCL